MSTTAVGDCTDQNACVFQDAIRASSLVRDSGQTAGATIDQFTGVPVSAVSGFKEEASPWCSDQVLPSTKTPQNK
jgi:hypothetical protein